MGEYSKQAATCAGCGDTLEYDEPAVAVRFEPINGHDTPRFRFPQVLCPLCAESLDDWFAADRETRDELRERAIAETKAAAYGEDADDGGGE